jgi:diacylglycerol kinase family enzyme
MSETAGARQAAGGPQETAGTAAGRVRIITNAAAGRRRGGSGERIREALAEAGIDAEIVAATGSLEDAVREAVEAGAPVVGVAGGDGTARAAAQALRGTDTPLIVFPTGTLNHFSRSVGIDSIEKAASALAARRVVRIAVGDVNGVAFLNTATFGLYADVLRRRERQRRWLGKWPAALAGFLVTIARYRPVEVALDIEGEELRRETALVRVGMGRESFPMPSQPPEARRAPVLEIGILRAYTRGRLIVLGARTMLRAVRIIRSSHDPAVEVLHTRAFTLRSARHRIGITLDGEIVHVEGTLRVGVHDASLPVVVAPIEAE